MDFKGLVVRALHRRVEPQKEELATEEVEFIAREIFHRGEVARLTKYQLVICLTGMPYSGKSTALKVLAPSLGAAPLEEDRIRLEADGLGLDPERAMIILVGLVKAFLGKGQNIAIDCDLTRPETRKAIKLLAGEFKARIAYVAV